MRWDPNDTTLLCALLDALKTIEESGPVRRTMGVCGNVAHIMRDNMGPDYWDIPFSVVPDMAIDWPLSRAYGRYHMFPVLNDPTLGLWESNNGRLRNNLVKHLIKKVEDLLA